MITGAIIVGILIFALIILGFCINNSGGGDFETGVWFGVIISILIIIEASLFASITEEPIPSALDVYQGKTTLEYTIRDGVKADSIVIFKENNYEKD